MSQGPADDGSEARGAHLGFVAHEIRNPLSTALWTAELLVRMSAADRAGARGDKLSGMCLRAISRVRLLIEDHFLSERLDAGGLSLRVDPTPAREAVAACLARLGADLGPVTVDVPADLAALADRALLERALDALLGAAGAERTPVAVTAEAGEAEVVLRICGRPAEAAALADPVKGSPSDPTGRALAIPLARRIAAALGGALSAEGGAWRLALRRTAAAPPAAPP